MQFLQKKSAFYSHFICLQSDPPEEGSSGSDGNYEKWNFRKYLKENALWSLDSLVGSIANNGIPQPNGLDRRTKKMSELDAEQQFNFLEDCAFYENCLIEVIREINQWDIFSDDPKSLEWERFAEAISHKENNYSRIKFFVDQILIFNDLGGHDLREKKFINIVDSLQETDIGGFVVSRDESATESLKDLFLMKLAHSGKFSAVKATVSFAIWRTLIFDVLEALKTHIAEAIPKISIDPKSKEC